MKVPEWCCSERIFLGRIPRVSTGHSKSSCLPMALETTAVANSLPIWLLPFLTLSRHWTCLLGFSCSYFLTRFEPWREACSHPQHTSPRGYITGFAEILCSPAIWIHEWPRNMWFLLLCTFSGEDFSLNVPRPLAEQEPSIQNKNLEMNLSSISFLKETAFIFSSHQSQFSKTTFFFCYKNSPKSVLHLISDQ